MLLDPSVDTSIPFSGGQVTGSVARAGSFKGPALIVPTGINAATLTTRLRELGIFIEGQSLFRSHCRQRQRQHRQQVHEVKLGVNLIAHGRYWTAGQEIDESEVPANLCRYAMTDDDASRDEEKAPPPTTAKPKRTSWGRKPSKG